MPEQTVLALVQDLFFGERLEAALRGLGLKARVEVVEGRVRYHGEELVIVDLETYPEFWAPVVEDARAAGVPILAFGPHTDAHAFAAARAAGVTRAVAKSKLTQGFADLVQELLGT